MDSMLCFVLGCKNCKLRITLQRERSLIFTSIIKFKNNNSPTRLALSTGNTWETYN